MRVSGFSSRRTSSEAVGEGGRVLVGEVAVIAVMSRWLWAAVEG